MKRHFVGSLLTIAAILLGWFFFSFGRDWFLVYVIFGGAIFMAVLAGLDGRVREYARQIEKHAAPQNQPSRPFPRNHH